MRITRRWSSMSVTRRWVSSETRRWVSSETRRPPAYIIMSSPRQAAMLEVGGASEQGGHLRRAEDLRQRAARPLIRDLLPAQSFLSTWREKKRRAQTTGLT
jgi:hypothetical protein